MTRQFDVWIDRHEEKNASDLEKPFDSYDAGSAEAAVEAFLDDQGGEYDWHGDRVLVRDTTSGAFFTFDVIPYARATNKRVVSALDVMGSEYDGRPVVTAEAALLLDDVLAERATDDPLRELTPRERQVYTRLAVGMSNRDIAVQLDISPKTVDTHRMHVMRKLNLTGNVHLARHALRHKIVTLDGVS